jgi:hypothetical protein
MGRDQFNLEAMKPGMQIISSASSCPSGFQINRLYVKRIEVASTHGFLTGLDGYA